MHTLLEHPKPLFDYFKNQTIRRYQANEIILKEGDKSESIFLIEKGQVVVSLQESDCQSIILNYLYEGDFFGEIGIFKSEAVRSAQVTAKEECKIIEISYREFKARAAKNPNILYSLSHQLFKRLQKANIKVLDLAFIDVQGRIARTLLDLGQKPDAMSHPEGVQIKITRQEMARIVGCSRESAGKVFRDLDHSGIIKISEGSTIVIKDNQQL